MSTLPDEILSEILSPALKVSDDLFSDTYDVSPFATPAVSSSAYLLVCRDWLGVATPLLYNVVILRSRSQANALEKVLQKHKAFGRFIRKLRVEGGYGMAMHTILKSAPNITDIFLSLAIWASDNTQGLCKGLPLIDPHRVILVDPGVGRPLKNKNLTALTKVILRCIPRWHNLRVFDFPYFCSLHYLVSAQQTWMTRAANLAGALALSQVETVLIQELYHALPDFFLVLSKIPSVRVLQLTAEPSPRVRHAVDTDARLKALVRYPSLEAEDDDDDDDENPVPAPDIPPSLNPSFVPLAHASGEVRDMVWKRVLFSAMHVEQRRSVPREKSLPSPLPFLLVSKYISGLALPYLYDCLHVANADVMSKLASRVKNRPELGPCIRSMYLPFYFGESTGILNVFSCATNLKILSTDIVIPSDHLEVLAGASGSSLQRLSFRLTRSEIATSVFTRFPEVQVLELSVDHATITHSSAATNALKNLHTLRIGGMYNNFSVLDAFSMMSLEFLHTLILSHRPYYSERLAYQEGLAKFLNAHRMTLRHFEVELLCPGAPEFKLFDVCRELLDISFVESVSPDFLDCTAPHTSLTKIFINGDLINLPEDFDPTMFPVLREIQIPVLDWPTTEREISKSEWVPLAEKWLGYGIKLTDADGQHWIPRVKRSRGR
ncbi:hypothetical protein DFH06DRAFT_532957 [Mycena polygramma]|nr:hypothetical protein DFH06DRAFT_532957 [Mycena polygramma]